MCDFTAADPCTITGGARRDEDFAAEFEHLAGLAYQGWRAFRAHRGRDIRARRGAALQRNKERVSLPGAKYRKSMWRQRARDVAESGCGGGNRMILGEAVALRAVDDINSSVSCRRVDRRSAH